MASPPLDRRFRVIEFPQHPWKNLISTESINPLKAREIGNGFPSLQGIVNNRNHIRKMLKE
jgi:hypothetical protein